ncbi:MAG: hypothetical protein KC503_39545 [Myxococcales bacterium]|nr:hypothetical protein [Myxococcales bacterium]
MLLVSGCSLLVDSKLDDKKGGQADTTADATDAGVDGPRAEGGAETSPDSGNDATPADELCNKQAVAIGNFADPGAANQATLAVDSTDLPSVVVVASGNAVKRLFYDVAMKKWAEHAVNIPPSAGAGATNRVAAAFDERDRLHVFVGREATMGDSQHELYHIPYKVLPDTQPERAPMRVGADIDYIDAASGGSSIWFATAYGDEHGLHRVNLLGANNFQITLCQQPINPIMMRNYGYSRVAVSRDKQTVAASYYFEEITPMPGDGVRVEAFTNSGSGCPPKPMPRGADHRFNTAGGTIEPTPMVLAVQNDSTVIGAWIEAIAGGSPPGGTLSFGVFTGSNLTVMTPTAGMNFNPRSAEVALTDKDRGQLVVQTLAPQPQGPTLSWFEEGSPWTNTALAAGGGPLVSIAVDRRNRLHVVYSRQGASGPELAYVCRDTTN